MIKLSNSGVNTYSTCSHSYRLKYIEQITSLYESSALKFGGAIDEALNHMLLNKDNPNVLQDSINVFTECWTHNKDRKGNITDMPKNPYILYSKYDYDPDLLEKSDWALIFKEINDPFKYRNEISDILKTKDFEDLDKDMQQFYNYTTWLCLKNKGAILLKGYYEQLLPEVDKVIDVQKSFNLDDGQGNLLNGIIDFICVLKNGLLVVADNKTSSMTYEEDSVRTSTQLSLYVKVLNLLNDDSSVTDWNVGHIEHAAYFVMSKKLSKDITKTCSTCGHVGEGSHKTCDNIINETRCNGTWEKTKVFDVTTQLVVDRISENVQDMVIENFNNVKEAILENKFAKNLTSCHGKFGKCSYYNYCYYGDDKRLKKG